MGCVSRREGVENEMKLCNKDKKSKRKQNKKDKTFVRKCPTNQIGAPIAATNHHEVSHHLAYSQNVNESNCCTKPDDSGFISEGMSSARGA